MHDTQWRRRGRAAGGAVLAGLAAWLFVSGLAPPVVTGVGERLPAAPQQSYAFEVVAQLGGTTGAIAVTSRPDPLSHADSAPRYAFVGLGPRLVTLDVTDPARPAVAAESAPLLSVVRDIAIDGARVYVVTGAQLYVFDVVDPVRPVELGVVGVPGERVVVSGGYAYIPGRDSGLAVVDVRDAARPQVVQRLPSSSSDVVVRGGYAYSATSRSFAGLEVIDVSDPPRAALVGSYRPRLWGNDRSTIVGVAIVGDHLYAAGLGSEEGRKLRVLEISDPARPREVGSYATGCAGWPLYPAVHQGGSALICRDQILGLADPVHPALLGTLPLAGDPASVAADGRLVYVAELPREGAGAAATGDAGPPAGGVRIFELSEPGRPTEVGSLPLGRTLGIPARVTRVGRFLYVDGPGSTDVVDVSVPSSPRVVGQIPTLARARVVTGDRLYEVQSPEVLRVLDVADPRTPREIGVYRGWPIFSLRALGTTVLAQGGCGELCVIDAANPSAMRAVPLSYTPPTVVYSPLSGGQAELASHVRDVMLAGGGQYAYVVFGHPNFPDQHGLAVLDLADPSGAREVAVHRFADIGSVLLAGQSLYLVSGARMRNVGGGARLHVLDVSHPASTQELGSGPLPAATGALVGAAGQYVITDGLRLLDVSDPAAVAEVGMLSNPMLPPGTLPTMLALAWPYLYVTQKNGGLWIFRLRGGM